MRALLSDSLDFRGPIDTFASADDYVAALTNLSGIKESIEIKKSWVDGPDVILWQELKTKVADPAPVVEWHHVEGGKITRIEVVFDARPFAWPPG